MHIVGQPKKKPVRTRGKQKKEAAWNSPVELSEEEELRFRQFVDYYHKKEAWHSNYTSAARMLIRMETLAAKMVNDLKETKDLIQTFGNGVTQISPKASALIKLNSQWILFQREFGMTPSSNQKIDGLGDGNQMKLPFEENPFHSKAK